MSDTKFKVGDIVRYTNHMYDTDGSLFLGGLYKVTGKTPSGHDVYLEGESANYDPRRFVLEAAAPEVIPEPVPTLPNKLTAILVDIDCLVLSVAYGDDRMKLLEKIKGISKAVRELRDAS